MLRDPFRAFPACTCRLRRYSCTSSRNNLSLPEREGWRSLRRALASIWRMRFGLEDDSEHTLEEVGRAFAVTRERIRQIEAKALRKLRQPSRSGKLRLFLDNVHE